MSSALDSFLDKWRTRWPEWSQVEGFIPAAERERVVAWFALLQEFDDILNTSGDPMPSDAKLAWWGEELRGWSAQRSKHPLGRLLEPVRAPWAELAQVLPHLVQARAANADPQQARQSLAAYANAVAAVEQAMFGGHARGDAAAAVLTQTLAQRLQDLDSAAVPHSLQAPEPSVSVRQWGRELLSQWPARVAGPRPRRMWSALARSRQQAKVRGQAYAPKPIGVLWRCWWAGRG
ncbi:squalene/phytoene synthase family protein [Stenotrophomonas sp. YIM B06876]|uniref:squalene/phytoene synthase family protein n=1 Tax=Stenotrophomonas sp. YIM B06876 TaxID=3060211 RepID=UPI00273A3485|nr:squalene/phytoene synthase family protein [Stenotrophomonas sp. YIM B06876]